MKAVPFFNGMEEVRKSPMLLSGTFLSRFVLLVVDAVTLPISSTNGRREKVLASFSYAAGAV